MRIFYFQIPNVKFANLIAKSKHLKKKAEDREVLLYYSKDMKLIKLKFL